MPRSLRAVKIQISLRRESIINGQARAQKVTLFSSPCRIVDLSLDMAYES